MISKMVSIYPGIQSVGGMFLNCDLKGDDLKAMLMELCTLSNIDRRPLDTLSFLPENDSVNYGLLR